MEVNNNNSNNNDQYLKYESTSLKKFLDYLDDPADIQLAIMHGRCQRAYKILTNDLEGKL
jgi:hypothetical protein